MKKEEIIFENKSIGNSKIEFRRQLGIEFVPEERNNHATVPDLKLHENTFLTFFGYHIFNKSFFNKMFTNPTLSIQASKQIETLTPSEVKVLLEKNKCTLIDVRDIRELWKEGTVKNSKHIPRGMLEFWLDPQSSYYKEGNFSQNKKMILFCALGFRSALSTKSLVDMGFENVAHVDGGFDALKKNGFEIVAKEKN